ncbi:MAG: hypothetical protein IH861_04145 [Chloroflexi bacterium]|nr:hypothetical protein [Chloroflexota bacterium]
MRNLQWLRINRDAEDEARQVNRALKVALFIGVAIALVGCVRELPRDGAATATPEIQAPTRTAPSLPVASIIPTPTSTVGPAAPRATSTRPPEPTATPTESPAPEPTPTQAPLVETPTPMAPRASPTPEQEPALFLDVRGPADGSIVQIDGVVVHGITLVGALVSVNGEVADVDDEGGFQIVVALVPGENVIEIVARDSSGNRQEETLTVTSLVLPPQPFFLLITQPETQSIVSQKTIVLAGRTSSGSIVSVNGVSVPVDTLGIFSSTITLGEGPNIIDVLATSNEGDVLSSIIAIIYRP